MPIHDWTRVNAGIFHHFHHRWISAISDTLNAGLLPADYYALAEQLAGGLGPDVLTLQGNLASPVLPRGNGAPSPLNSQAGGVALATAPPQVRFTASGEPELYARKRNSVVIRHSTGDNVIAVVEIVSPGNKASRHAFQAFVSKAAELLCGGIHLLVIDLFPPSSRDPQGIHEAIWSEIVAEGFTLPADKPLTLVSYSAGNLLRAFIEPVAVGDALPKLPLYLTPEGYIDVPMEATYRAAFESVPRRWRGVLEE
jgi:hypothetical protein